MGHALAAICRGSKAGRSLYSATAGSKLRMPRLLDVDRGGIVGVEEGESDLAIIDLLFGVRSHNVYHTHKSKVTPLKIAS